MTSLLTTSKQDDVLLEFLPFQGVRVDRIGFDGTDRASTCITTTGWAGLQAIYWNSFLSDEKGKVYPTQSVGDFTAVVRPKGILVRALGSYYTFPDLETARRALTHTNPTSTPIGRVMARLDHKQDTYGVVMNQQGSLLRFFEWINYEDTAHVIAVVGKERYERILGHVQYLTWLGDLISDDQVNMQIRFHADTEKAAADLGEMVEGTRQALTLHGRAGELQMAVIGEEVHVNVQMIGYKRMLMEFLKHPQL